MIMEKNDNNRRGGLSADDKEVLEIIRQTNEKYATYLSSQESLNCDAVVPSLASYNWDRPLTIVLSR